MMARPLAAEPSGSLAKWSQALTRPSFPQIPMYVICIMQICPLLKRHCHLALQIGIVQFELE